RNDSSLEKTEKRRDDVKRHEAVEEGVEKESSALKDGPEQEGADAANAVGDEARADATHDAEAQHQRQHLGAARDAITEIAAIGDDVHLRHRHRHATGNSGDAQEQ